MENKIVENVKNWIKALRSGKYKQGRGKLYDLRTDSYCCLGIAAVVLGREPSQAREACNEYLTPGAASAFGLCKRHQISLSIMNDRGDSFEKIAEEIEESILKSMLPRR